MPKLRGLLAVTVTVVIGVAACSSTSTTQPHHSVKSGPDPFASSDPTPNVGQASRTVASAGGTFASGDVRVVVPPGAVSAGAHIVVETGTVEGHTPGELFGQPLGVIHSKPLSRALTLTWTAPQLTAAQRRTLVLIKWDPADRAWIPQPIIPTIRGTAIIAKVRSFSVWDWAANVGQTVGEWADTRTGAPKCSKGAYPSWVENVVNTDDDSKAAAVLTCFQAGAGNNITAKVTNNRTFTQQLTMVHGGQAFADESLGDDGDYSVEASVYRTAHAVFDSKTTFSVPPLAAASVQIARPSAPGDYAVQAEAQVNVKTIFTDIVAFGFDQLDVGGTDNPLLNAFLEFLYKCGGKELLKTNQTGARSAVNAVISSIKECADLLGDPGSELGGQYQAAVQKAIRNAEDGDKDRIAKSYRLLEQARSAFKVLTIGEVAFYVSDQLANAYVGPLSLSVRGRGQPQRLGAWKPTCASTKADSNALYKNLALQDAFADTGKELWQFADWQPDATIAVAPLGRCSAGYRSELADYLPTSWGDKKAARVVAEQIRALGAASATPTQQTSTAPSAPVSRTYTPGSSFDDYCYNAAPFAPTYTSATIQMTMSCAHVPQNQFFLTQVVYGDPHLNVTPSTGQMHVVGKVIDTARSGYGYTILEVHASSISF